MLERKQVEQDMINAKRAIESLAFLMSVANNADEKPHIRKAARMLAKKAKARADELAYARDMLAMSEDGI